MKLSATCVLLSISILFSCAKKEAEDPIEGYEILDLLNGHWVGSNETAFGFFPWFTFDFRPISSSHVHSFYEGGTQENIITSVFVADYEGKKQIMARNGGWLGNQYRATYFLLDVAGKKEGADYFRLVDAIGGVDRSYIEFRFKNDSMYMDAFKDNSGSLDQPIHHMGFAGSNRNPSYAQHAIELFDFPQSVSEVDLNGKFINLIDEDSALFLEEQADPFPKSDHGHLSELSVMINRNGETENHPLMLYFSKEPIVNSNGFVEFANLENTVIRIMNVLADEEIYEATYLHPDEYYITIFSDLDNNQYPSSGDYTSVSTIKNIQAETFESLSLEITNLIQ